MLSHLVRHNIYWEQGPDLRVILHLIYQNNGVFGKFSPHPLPASYMAKIVGPTTDWCISRIEVTLNTSMQCYDQFIKLCVWLSDIQYVYFN